MPVRNALLGAKSIVGQNTVVHDYSQSPVERDNRRLIGVRNGPEPKWTCVDSYTSVSRTTKHDTLLRNRARFREKSWIFPVNKNLYSRTRVRAIVNRNAKFHFEVHFDSIIWLNLR